MKLKILLVALMWSGCSCEQKTWMPVCDTVQHERVFLECLRSTQNMGSTSSPGNDSDEVVDSCRKAAHEVACTEQYRCFVNCPSDGGAK